jgi:hypothetical protein
MKREKLIGFPLAITRSTTESRRKATLWNCATDIAASPCSNGPGGTQVGALGNRTVRFVLLDDLGARLRCRCAGPDRQGQPDPDFGRKCRVTAAGTSGRRRRGHGRRIGPTGFDFSSRVRHHPGRGCRTDPHLGILGCPRSSQSPELQGGEPGDHQLTPLRCLSLLDHIGIHLLAIPAQRLNIAFLVALVFVVTASATHRRCCITCSGSRSTPPARSSASTADCPLATKTRVCACDRAGYGWSDPGPQPRTPSQITEELHALLIKAGVQGAYVLVGHSAAGKQVRLYVHRYPHDVVGMVLLDAGHESVESNRSRKALAAEHVQAAFSADDLGRGADRPCAPFWASVWPRISRRPRTSPPRRPRRLECFRRGCSRLRLYRRRTLYLATTMAS